MPNPGTDPTNDDQKVEEPKEQKAPEPKEEKPKEEEKKYTDAEVNALLDKKFAEMSSKLEKKYAEQFKAERDKLTEAQKLEKMNDEEKAKYQNEQLQARIDELEKEKSLSEQMTVARKALKESNIAPGDDLLKMFVSPDAEVTKKNVDAFREMYTRDLNAAVQDALKRNPPKADPQTPGKGKSYGAQFAEKYSKSHAPNKEE